MAIHRLSIVKSMGEGGIVDNHKTFVFSVVDLDLVCSQCSTFYLT